MEMEEMIKERDVLAKNIFERQKQMNELQLNLEMLEKEIHERHYELDKLEKLMSTTTDKALKTEMERRAIELKECIEALTAERMELHSRLSMLMCEIKNSECRLVDIENSMARDAELKRKLSQIDSYRSVEKVNQEEFSRLVQAAMGKRSMRQFANDVGYNVSSISRIVNNKLSGTCSDEMLASIALHAAKGSGVTVDKLMAALGRKKILPATRLEGHVKHIIRNELMDRGYSVTEEDPERLEGPGFSFQFDYSIKTNAVPGNDGRWVFDTKPFNARSQGNDYSASAVYRKARQELVTVMSLMYCGTLNADKVSICIGSGQAFGDMTASLKGLKVKNNISIVLIDKDRVEAEYIIPLIEGATPKSVFKNKKTAGDTEHVPDIEWDDSMLDEND